MNATPDDAAIEAEVRAWVERVVVELDLCPFAAALDRKRQLRVCVSRATDGEALLAALHAACRCLLEAPEIETTIVAVPDMLADFGAYNDFLDPVDALLAAAGWEGELQVASFHPRYRFDGTADDDPANLTNRSPWPLLQVLREASVERAISAHPDAAEIPQRNVRTLRELDAGERAARFAHLD